MRAISMAAIGVVPLLAACGDEPAADGAPFVLLGSNAAALTDAPFPADDLRLGLAPPDLTGLTDHRGATLAADDLRGKVVVMTSVYACCPLACPVLLSEAKTTIGQVPEELRGDLVVLALTMDPVNDTPEKLAELAVNFEAGPEWRFLTGDQARVESLLDEMGVARERNEETGEIDHNVIFLYADRAGRLAYRLGMPDEARRGWHVEAMTGLLREAKPGA